MQARERVWTGRCTGGPLDGTDFTSRRPVGFVIIRKGGQWSSWWYRTSADGTRHQARGPEPITRDEARALAQDTQWDVVAYDPERMGPW
jgi:hypothetical protein